MKPDEIFRIKFQGIGRAYWSELNDVFHNREVAEREAFEMVHSKRADHTVVLEMRPVVITEISRVKQGDAGTHTGAGINVRHPNTIVPKENE